MEDDVIDNENDLLDFDDTLGEKDSTLMTDLSAKGSLSDIEIDYETRSEISDDDEDNAEDTGRTEHSAENSGLSMEIEAATKTNEKRRVSLTKETKDDFKTDESRSNERLKQAEQTSKSKKNSDVEESMLKTLFQGARFFLMKTSDANNLKVSQLRQLWFTDPQNVTVLNSAVETSKNVILIFSAKWTGRFSGFALLKGRSTSDDPPRDWAPSVKTLGGSFHVKWLSRKELFFSSTNHLTNPSSGGKLVSICVDGQEIYGKVGQELCELLIHKGVKPKESADQRKNESPVESQRGNELVREKSSSKSRASRMTDTLGRSRHENYTRKGSNDRERSTRLRRVISHDRTRIRSLSRSVSNLPTHSPVWGSDRIEMRSSGFDSNYTRSERRGRSPVRREHRVRGGHSSDRKIRSSIERSRTRERYHSRESPRQVSIAPDDLRYKTSRGQYRSLDRTNRKGQSPDISPLDDMYQSGKCDYSREADLLSPTRRSETGLYDYQSYDSFDDLDESAEPTGMSGRFVIVRSPISQTEPPSLVVQTELSPDSYELMSENGSDHQVEPSNKAEVAPERYCTLAPSLPVEKSLSPGRLSVSHGTSEAPRKVYETHEPLGRSQSRGRSHISHRDPSLHLTERRSLSRGKSLATYDDKDYPSYESFGRRTLSHELSKTNRDVYISHESSDRSQSRRSPSLIRSRATDTDYLSHEVTRRRSRSRGRSQSTHRDYESHETSRVLSRSRDRSQATHREYESVRIRSRSHSRTHDTNRDYPHESYEQKLERHMDSRMRRLSDEIYPEQSPSQKLYDFKRDGYNSRRAEGIPQIYGIRESEIYDERTPVKVMNSESRSRYSVPEESMDGSSLHHRSSELKRRRRDYSEHRDDRSRRYSVERSSSDPRWRGTPEPRPYPERAPEGVGDYRHSRDERYDQERRVPLDSGMHRSDAARDRYQDQRSTNHYYAQANQNNVPPMYGLHVPPPAVSSLPASHQNYYRSLPPPLLPPVSSKFFEPVSLQSPLKYNPTVPPPMIAPAPSKYVDDVPAAPPDPLYITPKPHGLSTGGIWLHGQRSVPAHYNQKPTQKYLSAEEFIELCRIKNPMRGSTAFGSRRRH